MASPIELTGCSALEIDREIPKLDRSPTGIGVHHDSRGDGSRQAKIVSSREAVDKHANLIASGEGVDQLPVVRRRGSLRKLACFRFVVQTAVDPSKLAGLNHSLKCLVDSVTRAKVEEIRRRPDLDCVGVDPSAYC